MRRGPTTLGPRRPQRPALPFWRCGSPPRPPPSWLPALSRQPPPQHGQPPLPAPPSRPLLLLEQRAGNGGSAAPSQGAAGRGPRHGAGRGRPLGPPPPPHSAPSSRRRNFPPAVPAATFPPQGSGEDSLSFPALLPSAPRRVSRPSGETPAARETWGVLYRTGRARSGV